MTTTSKTFSLPCSTTIHSLLESSVYSKTTNSFSLNVASLLDKQGFAIYEWTFPFVLSSEITSIQSASLSFYYRMAYTGNTSDISVFLLTEQPSTISDEEDLWNSANDASASIGTASVFDDRKTVCVVTLNSVGCTALQEAINNDSFFALVIKQSDSERTFDTGGITLIDGNGTPWEQTSSTDSIAGPPVLEATYTVAEISHPYYSMKYTTSDPTAEQSSPGNSLGGYLASNDVFYTAQIGENIIATQTAIPIAGEYDLPSKTGAAQIGPEIIRFASIDSTNYRLAEVTRGVAPYLSQLPAAVDQYAEYIRYLDTSRLFQNTSSIQYRCVAIVNSSSFTISEMSVDLYQNSTIDTQIDIGIEAPLFSSRTAQIAGDVSSLSLVFYSSGSNVVDKEDNFFAGGHIIIDPTGVQFNAIIEEYTNTDGLAQFALDRAMPEFADGTAFVINPAPAQRVANESIEPAGERFLGFFAASGSHVINTGVMENYGTLEPNDCFYLWIKRNIVNNVKAASDIGASIVLKFKTA